jgi:demethylmenaquinone methyltransferase/2-methoxy-6-polyprenyl-1,4-benzoquinol methylase
MKNSLSCCGYSCCIEKSLYNELYIIEKSSHSGKITELYSQISWLYDIFTDHELPHHLEAIRMVEIKKGDVILEVACGTGRATVEMAKRIGERGKIYAIDLTEAMLKRAKKKIEKYDLIERVDLRVGDARKIPFPDEMFDLVYNAYMFDLIDLTEFPSIISEFKRVLKPGGRLVLVNMSKNKSGKTLYEILYEKGLLWITSGGCRPVYLKPYVEEAGFENVRRFYRKNQSFFFLNLLVGTEIVIGYKPLKSLSGRMDTMS